MGSPGARTLPGSYKLCPFCRAPYQCFGLGWSLPPLLDLRALAWRQRDEGRHAARLKGRSLLHRGRRRRQRRYGGFGPGVWGGETPGSMRCASLGDMLQCASKVLDRGEALFGLFGERSQHHFLNGRREVRNSLAQGWRWSSQVLGHDLRQRPPQKGSSP